MSNTGDKLEGAIWRLKLKKAVLWVKMLTANPPQYHELEWKRKHIDCLIEAIREAP